MPADQRIVAVCAMGLEAWGVRRRAPGIRVLRVGIGGAAPAGDASIVISAGVCGGLLPDQAPGTVVIGTSVSDESGTIHACDPVIAARLERAARSLGVPVVTGSVVSTSAMVTGAARRAWADRGHVAVDMESAAAAATAPRFGAVRVIVDSPQRELSPAWVAPGRAALRPSNWVDGIWLAIHMPEYALRAGAVLQAAFLGDIDPEV
jgi:4-hydroxy-3-methylbut-2-en-1-yl diphosphate reductase